MKPLWIAGGAGILLAAALWLVTMVRMPLRSFTGALPPLDAGEELLRDRLEEHVFALAGRIGERNIWHPESLDSAAAHIRESFEESALTVHVQEYTVDGRRVENIEVSFPGTSLPGETVLVGAHYDSVSGCPGANDNATGVAALLELARLLGEKRLARTVRLVAFVNEEPPFFQTAQMGSLVYARAARRRGEQIVAMLSLETIGYYTDEPGSQNYPPPFGLVYPDRGNFVGFVGDTASRDLVRRCVGSFRRHTKFPSEGVAAPGEVAGIGWSDHWAFWQEGWPAVMVTDTAPFRYAHYHSPSDTPDRIEYPSMARVVAGLARVVADLADGTAP